MAKFTGTRPTRKYLEQVLADDSNNPYQNLITGPLEQQEALEQYDKSAFNLRFNPAGKRDERLVTDKLERIRNNKLNRRFVEMYG